MRVRDTLGLVLLLACSGVGRADSQDGGLRDKVREKWIKRQEAKPAPDGLTDPHMALEKPGTYTFQILHDAVPRFYTIHVPARYSPATPGPLLFVLHGGGGDMRIQANDAYYGHIAKSDAEGFVAVFPNGASKFASGKLATWNAGRCCAYARDRNVDDVGFIREIIKNLSQQIQYDKNRVYASGMSNGGMMAYRLACEMPETIKAIAAVAGTDNTVSCRPASPVSILHIHARDDDHVLFQGGAGQTFRDKSTVTEFTSVPDTIAKWVKLNSCMGTPKRVLEKKGAYCERYSGCRNEASVQLCVTETGGHSWPGGKKPRMLASGHPSKDIVANDVMWDFFNGL
jgi:polyhydroxybutyrate depolymerase